MAITSPRSTSRNNFQVVPYWDESDEHAFSEWCRSLAEGVNDLFDGKSNAVGSVTLAASLTTTTLSDIRIGSNSVILFTPTTENARVAGIPAVTAKADGSATLIHASDAATDQTFDYWITGGG